MYKVAIDLLSYENGKALGYNSYVHALLEAITLSKNDELNIDIFILKSQKKYFLKYEQSFNIKAINISKTLSILLFQNIFYLFYKHKYNNLLFTANTAPLFLKNFTLVIHDLNFLKFKKNFTFLQLLYRKILIKKSIKNAKHVIAISKYVKEEVELYSQVTPFVIHNPLTSNNSPYNKNILQKIFKNSTINKYFLIPSSLSIHKNIDQCVEAVEQICMKYPNVGFVFIGNWDINHFPIHNNYNQIKPLGFVDEFIRLSLFNCVDYILFPSLYEGFGLPYLESILFNKPIICSDIPIAREILDDTPIYINSPYKSENIFYTINSIIETPIKLNHYRQFNLQNYNFEIGKKYINLL